MVLLRGRARGSLYSHRRALGYFVALNHRTRFVLDAGTHDDLRRRRFAWNRLRVDRFQGVIFIDGVGARGLGSVSWLSWTARGLGLYLGFAHNAGFSAVR